MSCKKCKNNPSEEMKKEFENTNNLVIGFVIVWSLFALYGIYSLFQKVI
jgi:hypothetical protein